MEITIAREIVKRAQADSVLEGEIPESDAEMIAKANELVEMAEQAYANHVRGPEVQAILNLAANGSDPEGSSDNGDDHAPPESDDEQPLTPSVFQNLDPKLSKSEPWDGYSDMPVKDVTEGIVWFYDNAPDEIFIILKNVWAFESAHKERTRILDFVREAFVKYGGDLGDESQEQEESGSVDSTSGSDSDEEVSELPQEENEDVSGSGADGPESDAGADTKPEKGTSRSEGSSGQSKPTGQDKPQRSEGGSGGQSAEAKLIEIVERELARERVDGIPAPPKDKAPELPWEWANIPDQQLHDLHMQYASLAYYKAYRRTRDDRIAQLARDAGDEIRNKLLTELPKYDDKNKEVKVTVLEAQIASDPNIKRWRKLQHKYERFASAARQEVESLHKVVEALSRLETMRHDAWERSR